MNDQRGWLAAAVLCATVVGLACGSPRVTVEDFVLGGRAELLAVDGQPVERAQSRYVTVVPVALVKPGAHTFLVRLRADESDAPEETLLVSAAVVAGKRYRLEVRSGAVQLVEKDGVE